MLQTLIDQKTVKPGNWSSLTVFLWFQLSKMGLYSKKLWFAINFSKYVGIWGNIDHLGRFIHIAKKINDRSVFTDSFFDRLFA